MENDNQESKDQVQNQDQEKEVEKTEEKPKAKEEPTVTKQIEKMRKRIDREVGQRKEVEGQKAELEHKVKTLSAKLESIQSGKDSEQPKSKNSELDRAMNENQKLKAQIVRRDQMDTVAQQFNDAGVIIPKEVLSLVVPAGIDEKQVSANMKALSSFYDSVVQKTKQEFLKSSTPRTTGSDDKPFNKNEIIKIKDPVERVKMIQEHIKDYR